MTPQFIAGAVLGVLACSPAWAQSTSALARTATGGPGLSQTFQRDPSRADVTLSGEPTPLHPAEGQRFAAGGAPASDRDRGLQDEAPRLELRSNRAARGPAGRRASAPRYRPRVVPSAVEMSPPPPTVVAPGAAVPVAPAPPVFIAGPPPAVVAVDSYVARVEPVFGLSGVGYFYEGPGEVRGLRRR